MTAPTRLTLGPHASLTQHPHHDENLPDAGARKPDGDSIVDFDACMYVQGARDFEPDTHLLRGLFGGVTELRITLVQLGIGFDSLMPEFPDNDFLDRSDFHDGEPVTERAKLYTQALERTLTEHDADAAEYLPGIPTHKLASNDGWHVTDKECAEALAAYEMAIQAGAEHPAAFDDDVIPFLRTAANHQGFRVH